MTVIRERYAVTCHSGKIRKLLALLTDCDRSIRINVDTRITVDDILLHLQMLSGVRNRRKIRHGADSSVSAVSRSL